MQPLRQLFLTPSPFVKTGIRMAYCASVGAFGHAFYLRYSHRGISKNPAGVLAALSGAIWPAVLVNDRLSVSGRCESDFVTQH